MGRHIVEHDVGQTFIYLDEVAAPLCNWVQYGHCIEMRVRANKYRSNFMEKLHAEMVGEFADGAPVEMPHLDAGTGVIHSFWYDFDEFKELGNGLVILQGRQLEEAKTLLLVCHVILEQLMTSQRSVSWGVYDSYYYGILRGYLREAINHTDLSEGVRWLVL